MKKMKAKAKGKAKSKGKGKAKATGKAKGTGRVKGTSEAEAKNGRKTSAEDSSWKENEQALGLLVQHTVFAAMKGQPEARCSGRAEGAAGRHRRGR